MALARIVIRALVILAPPQFARAARMMDADFEDAAALDTINGTLLGTQCTDREMLTFWDRFQIGEYYGKPCREEDTWGTHIEYHRGESPNTIALYLYPRKDDVNAFGFCWQDMFDLGTCKRLYEQSQHYSVQFYRVNSVEEATDIVRSLPLETKIKHLVLAGHGKPTSFQWGDGSEGSSDLVVEDDASDEFLDAVYPHLLLGQNGSTVMLDACSNGKVLQDKNMVQHVAHRLAGATVYGAKVEWAIQDFYLGSSKDFDADIIKWSDEQSQWKSQMVNLKLGTGALRDWKYSQGRFCDDKAHTAETGVREIHQCREACERSNTCKAFVWYPSGNCPNLNCPSQKCYLSDLCDKTTYTTRGAMIFKE